MLRGIASYHLRPKRIPTSVSPRFSSQRSALDMWSTVASIVPTLRQHYSDRSGLSKIGGATEVAVVARVKRGPCRALQEKPPGEKHIPGKPRVNLTGIPIGTDRRADVEPRSQKVVQDAALVFWTEAFEQHLDIDIGGTVFVFGRAIHGLKDADASFVDEARRGVPLIPSL